MGYMAIDEIEVVRLYTKERFTLRMVAEKLGTNHHTIKRILIRNNVAITRQNRLRIFTQEHKDKISKACKGRVGWASGKTLPESFCRANMKGRMGTKIDLDQYADYEKLKLLSGILSRHKKHLCQNDAMRKAFLDKFYFDPAFNAIYDLWISSGKNKWYYPSIDHIEPKSNGGNFALDNLRFITWFENRAKADMTFADWNTFKEKTGTCSRLFIEEILNDYNRRSEAGCGGAP